MEVSVFGRKAPESWNRNLPFHVLRLDRFVEGTPDRRSKDSDTEEGAVVFRVSTKGCPQEGLHPYGRRWRDRTDGDDRLELCYPGCTGGLGFSRNSLNPHGVGVHFPDRIGVSTSNSRPLYPS